MEQFGWYASRRWSSANWRANLASFSSAAISLARFYYSPYSFRLCVCVCLATPTATGVIRYLACSCWRAPTNERHGGGSFRWWRLLCRNSVLFAFVPFSPSFLLVLVLVFVHREEMPAAAGSAGSSLRAAGTACRCVVSVWRRFANHHHYHHDLAAVAAIISDPCSPVEGIKVGSNVPLLGSNVSL